MNYLEDQKRATATVSPHVQRMVTENNELTERVDKLTAFINSNLAYLPLPDRDKKLLDAQRHAMRAYSAILGLRISLAVGERLPPAKAPLELGEPMEIINADIDRDGPPPFSG